MKLTVSFFLVLAWLFSFCSASYAETKIDSGSQYFGVYESVLGFPYESEEGTIYRDQVQYLEITKGSEENTRYGKEHGVPANISIHLNGTNGHTCLYEGTGSWVESRDRFEFTSDPDDEPVCKLVVIIKNNSAYPVTQQSKACRQGFCGMRNSLDGWIIEKVK